MLKYFIIVLTKKQLSAIRATVDRAEHAVPLAFQALGDPGRFQIFRVLLRHRDICVTDIANIFGITVSAASQQLRVLERVGLILKIRMGQMICYETNRANPLVKQLIKFFTQTW